MNISDIQRKIILEALDDWNKAPHGSSEYRRAEKQINLYAIGWLKLLLNSEQAWREEATKVRKGVPTGEYMVLSDGVEVEIYKDPLIVISQLREQLNQAVEVLKLYGKDPVAGNHARFTLQQMGIEATVSSLSQEV